MPYQRRWPVYQSIKNQIYFYLNKPKESYMTTFNKILNPLYSTISGFNMDQSGAMNVVYQIGTATENEENQVTEFNPIVTEYKYLDAQQATEVMMQPLKKDDVGKSFQELMIGRICDYMKEKGMIQV